MAAAGATTPALIWQDISTIAVQCLVQPTSSPNHALQTAMCDKVRALASQGAPGPVTVVPQGDASMFAPGTVTLLVHASVQPAGRERLVAFAVRPFRLSADQNSILFGAAPRAATIPDSAAGSPALDAAMMAALSETLPWLARPAHPQPINSPATH